MTEGKEAVKKAKEFVERNKPDLIMNRVPKKTLDFFFLLSKEEFADDYGLCMKYCVDQCKEYQSMKIAFLEGKLNDKKDL